VVKGPNVAAKQIPIALPWMERWKEEKMDRFGFLSNINNLQTRDRDNRHIM